MSPPRLSAPLRIYLLSFVITNIGVGGFTLAMGLVLFATTGSATAFALAVSAEFALGMVGQAVGAAVLDRLPVSAIAIGCNATRAVAVCTGAAVALGTGTVAPLIAVFLISAVLRPVFRAASFAFATVLARPEHRVRVNALRSGLLQCAQLGGLGLVAAVNAAAGPLAAVLAVSGCFGTGTALLLLISRADSTRERRRSAAQEARTPLTEWRTLGSTVRRTPSILGHLGFGALAPCAAAILAVFVAPASAALPNPALGVVLLDGAGTAGALLGFLLLRRLSLATMRPCYLTGLTLMTAGGLCLAVGAAHLPAATAGFLIVGIGIAVAATANDSLLQQRVHPDVFGRIALLGETANSIAALLLIPIVASQITGNHISGGATIFTTLSGALAAVFLLTWSRARDTFLTTAVPARHPTGQPA